MRRSNLLATSLRVMVAIVLLAVPAIAGLAQTGDDTQPARKADSTRHRHPMSEWRAAQKAGPTQGWLILEGKYVPGPYEIAVEDDWLRINGLRAFAPPEPPKIDTTIHIDSSIIVQHNVTSTMRDSFRVWLPRLGFERAGQSSLEFMLVQPIVDTAYLTTPYDLCVVFKETSLPYHLWLEPIIDPPEPPEKVRREFLVTSAEQLRGWLSHGNLVIVHGGGGAIMAIEAYRAKDVLMQLQQVVDSIPNPEARSVAIRKIISDREIAEEIAREFNMNQPWDKPK